MSQKNIFEYIVTECIGIDFNNINDIFNSNDIKDGEYGKYIFKFIDEKFTLKKIEEDENKIEIEEKEKENDKVKELEKEIEEKENDKVKELEKEIEENDKVKELEKEIDKLKIEILKIKLPNYIINLTKNNNDNSDFTKKYTVNNNVIYDYLSINDILKKIKNNLSLNEINNEQLNIKEAFKKKLPIDEKIKNLLITDTNINKIKLNNDKFNKLKKNLCRLQFNVLLNTLNMKDLNNNSVISEIFDTFNSKIEGINEILEQTNKMTGGGLLKNIYNNYLNIKFIYSKKLYI